MAHDTPPDLSQIRLARAGFLDCEISSDAAPGFLFELVVAFSTPAVTASYLYDLEEHEVAIELTIRTVAYDSNEQPLPARGYFRLHFVFEVANLSELLFVPPGSQAESKIPSVALISALLAVSYSTARGMILTKVTHTALNGFSLPLRSVQQIMADSNTIEEVAQPPKAAPKPKRTKRLK